MGERRTMKTSDAERKRAQRLRDKERGLTELRVKLEPEELGMLNDSAAGRRLFRSPYDLNEYIALLIREDHARLKRQLAQLQTQHCKKCGAMAPGNLSGCVCAGDSQCWQTRGRNKLLIKIKGL